MARCLRSRSAARDGYARENGAEQAAVARLALLRKLVVTAQTYLDTELDAAEAALETGRWRGNYPPRRP